MVFYFIAFLLSIVVFIYLYSTYQSGKEKLHKLTGKGKPINNITPQDIKYKSFITKAPGERLCPICRSSLSKYEALYASKVEKDGRSIIFIHGCRHCYKPDEDGEKKRKSDY